jgi:hypothetical protein
VDAATCDLCGCDLLLRDVHYIVDTRVYAAYDPLEISRVDLERDLEAELRALIAELHRKIASAATAQQIADSVCKVFRFDLCPECQRKFLAEPLGIGRPVPQALLAAPAAPDGTGLDAAAPAPAAGPDGGAGGPPLPAPPLRPAP